MEDPSTHASRRRDKPILSCHFCRARKLRCDRQSPCGVCLGRGRASECTYSASQQERKDAIDYRPHNRGNRARQRINRLESLVIELRDRADGTSQDQQSVDQSSPSQAIRTVSTHSSPANNQLSDDIGNLSLTSNHTVYTGSSHWVTILEDIQQIKDELSEEHLSSMGDSDPIKLDAHLMDGSPATKISLLDSAAHLSREQIMETLPSRKVVDRHISHFFNAFDMAPYFLCRTRFLDEYTHFWDEQQSASITWLGLLFSIMSMSAFLQQQEVGPSKPEAQGMLDMYRTMTIHCLIAGNYLRPSRYTMEALTLHVAVDQNVNVDASTSNWILLGVVIRIAFRIGLHRDPSHWPNIRPLDAELRRRLWMTLYQMDFFTSTQVGLPRIIKDSQCDARLPVHLFDHELGPTDDEVPPERQITQPTPLLYIILRDSIIKIAAEIYDATEAGPPSAEKSVALATKLEQAIRSVPSWLKYKPLEMSLVENPTKILHQIFLDILIHKATYLLHRRSFIRGPTGLDITESNDVCIKAALAILEHQQRISEEIEPGGIFSGIRWKVTSSLNQEFLQATMMLCFAVSRSREAVEAPGVNDAPRSGQVDIVQALTLSRVLWAKLASQSVEAGKAAKAISAVLQRRETQKGVTTTADMNGLINSPDLATDFDFSGFGYGQEMSLDPSILSGTDAYAAALIPSSTTFWVGQVCSL